MNAAAAIWIIRLSVSAVMVVFGLSQLIRPGRWLDYLPRLTRWLLPVRPESFMRSHGLGNLALGTLLASGMWPAVLLWAAIGWWVSILPFALRHDVYIGLRDMAIIAALAACLLLL